MADEAKVHAADMMDREGIKSLLGRVRDRFPRLSHLWVNAGYNGQDKGADWVVKALGWTAEIARHPPKVAPQDVMKAWGREWGKEGVTINWQNLCHLEPARIGTRRPWMETGHGMLDHLGSYQASR